MGDGKGEQVIYCDIHSHAIFLIQPGKPLRGFTFVLVGRAPHNMTHEDLSRMIERCGGRVLHGALPDARLPMKCTVLTQQSECSKSHDKVLATITEACRRGWEVMSYAFVIDAERSGTTPKREGTCSAWQTSGRLSGHQLSMQPS